MTNKSLRVVFFGTPSFVIPIAKTLQDNFTLVGIVTAPDAVQGRKKILTPSPVKVFAIENSIPSITYSKLNAAAAEELSVLKADLYVVAAYGLLIPQSILDLPRFGCINIHPSLLPQYRGASPIQSALLNGDKTSGVTIIQMDSLLDHGPIISQWETQLLPVDTFASLHTSMFEDTANKLPAIITDLINGKITPQPQDNDQATFCERITKESGYFDISHPPTPQSLDRMIRAYYPWPGAWTKIILHNRSQIIKFFPGKKIQLEGKTVMDLKDFYNGYPELRKEISGIVGEN